MTLAPRENFSRRILKIAIPAIAGMSAQMVVSIVETAMVGRLSNAVESLAAMGLGVLATWVLTSFFS
ncbi:MAG TPA: MATE family efflux transporter, partial [Bacteroidota bacterium]|nr:MATE family efflux transporter [Bacteroidota bacterium]